MPELSELIILITIIIGLYYYGKYTVRMFKIINSIASHMNDLSIKQVIANEKIEELNTRVYNLEEKIKK